MDSLRRLFPAAPWVRALRAGWRTLRDLLLLAFDRLAGPPARGLAGPEAAGTGGRVGVLQLHGLGDLLLFLPCLVRLRSRYAAPRWHLVLVVGPGAAGAAHLAPEADEVLVVDRDRFCSSPGYRAGTLGRMAALRFDVILQPAFNRYPAVEDALVRASGAAVRQGSAGDPFLAPAWLRDLGARGYHRLVPAVRRPMHELERYDEFLHGLGLPPAGLRPRLAPPAHPEPGTEPYVLIAPDASAGLKTWPAGKFALVARWLARRRGLRVLVAGGPDAAVPLEPGVDRLPAPGDLDDLVAWIAHARLVLTCDSAPFHLGVALGVPTVVVAGGGLPVRYHPYPPGALPPVRALEVVAHPLPCFGCGWRCVHQNSYSSPAPCLDDLPVAAVLRAIRRLLD